MPTEVTHARSRATAEAVIAENRQPESPTEDDVNHLLEIQLDIRGRELVLCLPPWSAVDTCVIFAGREVKRVEFLDFGSDIEAYQIWDSGNGPNDLHPTPVAGGYMAFHNMTSERRTIVLRAFHSGGVSCYMEHGPASVPFAESPEIRPNLASAGTASTTVCYCIDRDDAIEIVIVAREATNDSDETAQLRMQTETVVRGLLRAKVGSGGELIHGGLRAVA